MRMTKTRLVAVVMALGLLAAACGGGRSDSGGSDNPTATTTASGEESFGTLPSPCGPAEGTNGATATRA